MPIGNRVVSASAFALPFWGVFQLPEHPYLPLTTPSTRHPPFSFCSLGKLRHEGAEAAPAHPPPRRQDAPDPERPRRGRKRAAGSAPPGEKQPSCTGRGGNALPPCHRPHTYPCNELPGLMRRPGSGTGWLRSPKSPSRASPHPLRRGKSSGTNPPVTSASDSNEREEKENPEWLRVLPPSPPAKPKRAPALPALARRSNPRPGQPPLPCCLAGRQKIRGGKKSNDHKKKKKISRANVNHVLRAFLFVLGRPSSRQPHCRPTGQGG